MLILSAVTTDNLEVVLAGAVTTNQLPIIATYRNVNASTSVFTPSRNVLNTNSTTPVIAVAGNASYTQVIDTVNIYNNDTANATVSVRYDLNGTKYIIFKALLNPGDSLIYQDGAGWNVYTSSTGAVKSNNILGNSPVTTAMSRVVLAADVTNNNGVANTIADITGLSFAVNSGNTYWFRFQINYTAAATTTGSRWSVDGPTTSLLSYRSIYALTTTTQTTNHGVVAYNSPAASNASSAATTGNIALIEGFITPTANGTLIGRFASEVAGSAIVAKAGSVLDWQQVL